MARLPFVEGGTGDEAAQVAALYSQITALGRPVGNLYRVLANNPAALNAFLGMSRYVRNESGLDPRLRELAILATASVIDQRYEIAHHRPIALGLGVPSEVLDGLRDPGTRLEDPLEQAVVDYAREVAAGRDVSDATFERLRTLMPAATLTDLVVTVAWYHFCAAVLGPLHVEVESEQPADPR